MQQEKYDLVVAGSVIGGLTAGAFLVHWGYRTLVFLLLQPAFFTAFQWFTTSQSDDALIARDALGRGCIPSFPS